MEKVIRAAVKLRDRDQVIAGADDIEDGVGDGGLTRGMAQCAAAAFERRDAFSKSGRGS